ncbi:MAG: hypothetical protein H6737_11450 [Alphaproteobacteria bacterium]|nr:hypothetical protein [Alphaproteobacteria bacterium]
MHRLAFVLAAFAVVGCAPVEEETDLRPLDWTTPLAEDTLGVDPGPEFAGLTLEAIISGQVDARGEGRSCSACHFDGTLTFYRPEVEQYATTPIGPYDMVDGRTWAGNNGWGAIFATMGEGRFSEKPPELRVAMERFLDLEASRVQPLDWTTTIETVTLGKDPEAFIQNDTIDAIINSRVSGRPDDLLCSDCHYAGASIGYRPAIERGDTTTSFGPNDVIDGRSWSGPDGWAQVFVELGPNADIHKPDYVRQMFFKWVDDGAI